MSYTGQYKNRLSVSTNDREVPSATTNGTFYLYIYFLCDFFLHFSARVPAYGLLRPTLLLVLIISISLFMQRKKLQGMAQTPINYALNALLIYIAVSLPLVEWPGSVLKGNLSEFVKAIVFFFFTALIVDSEKRLKICLAVFMSCQVFRVLEPLYLNVTTGYWGSTTFLDGDLNNRLAGSPYDVINANELGFVIVTVLPFLYFFLFASKKATHKLLSLGLVAMLLYALILTMSRGAFLALLVVVWMIFKESKHKFGLIVLGMIVALGSFSVMTPIQKDRYLSLFSAESGSSSTVDGRYDLIKREFQLGFERPFVGHGLGTTAEAKFHNWGKSQASHNMYGELLIELGMLGAFFFVRFMFSVYGGVKRSRDLLQSNGEKEYQLSSIYLNLYKSVLVIFWMYAVYSLNYWGLSQYYWYFLAGLIVALERLLTRESQRIAESGKRK